MWLKLLPYTKYIVYLLLIISVIGYYFYLTNRIESLEKDIATQEKKTLEAEYARDFAVNAAKIIEENSVQITNVYKNYETKVQATDSKIKEIVEEKNPELKKLKEAEYLNAIFKGLN